MPSSVLVAMQMAALAAIVIPWHATAWRPWAWAPLAAAAIVGAWTLAHNRPGNFSVFPEPRAGARLVTSGPYAYVRHPMYLAVLLFALAFAIGWGTAAHWAIFAILALVLHAKATREERMLAERFPEYAGYMRSTRRFVPFVI